MNIILGNGISAYIIAACLKYHKKSFTILSDKPLRMPGIMLLKYENVQQLKLYFKLFGINYNEKNVAEYCKQIKVGYLFDGKIYDYLTDEMKINYLLKQNRINTNTALSDNTQNFNAILLHKIVSKLQDDYRYYVRNIRNIYIDDLKSDINKNNIFDTRKTKTFNENSSVEYLVNECDIDLLDYDYIYDCNKESPIKRYSVNCTEYIKMPKQAFVAITNYYDSPKMYDEYDLKNNIHHYYIGRYATQSQVKQEDVIKYMFKILKGEKHGI